jgi:hypothetical protein
MLVLGGDEDEDEEEEEDTVEATRVASSLSVKTRDAPRSGDTVSSVNEVSPLQSRNIGDHLPARHFGVTFGCVCARPWPHRIEGQCRKPFRHVCKQPVRGRPAAAVRRPSVE